MMDDKKHFYNMLNEIIIKMISSFLREKRNHAVNTMVKEFSYLYVNMNILDNEKWVKMLQKSLKKVSEEINDYDLHLDETRKIMERGFGTLVDELPIDSSDDENNWKQEYEIFKNETRILPNIDKATLIEKITGELETVKSQLNGEPVYYRTLIDNIQMIMDEIRQI